MRILLKNVTLTEPGAKNRQADVLVEDGILRKVAAAGSITDKADKVYDKKGLHCSPGWFDLRVNFCEPGYEWKEDIASGSRAAVRGGFTGVLLMPSTKPPVNGKADIEFIRSRSSGGLLNIVPAGTLSEGMQGRDMSELYDMWQSGARAFTDDRQPVADAGLLLRALMYTRTFNGLVMNFPDDRSLSAKGQMNEGVMNVQLGMRGMPALAEEVMVARDLRLAEYAGHRIHFSTVSTAGAVDLIRKAKAAGQAVTADVAVHHLVLDETALAGFDTNYKVKPPLRSAQDVEALMAAVADGTVDCVCSDHTPEDVENKHKEFELARFGIIGLETAFGLLNKALSGKLPLEQIVGLISTRPRQVLGIDVPSFREGEPAELTLFDPEEEWTFSEKDIASKSKNTPFVGASLKGRAVAVYGRGQWAECH